LRRATTLSSLLLVLALVVTAAPAEAQSRSAAVHHVQPGDTLWSLARRFGTTPEHLATLNAISVNDILSVGQVLMLPRVPTGPPAPEAIAKQQRPARSVAPRTTIHRVQAGETLWAISRRYGMRPEQIAALNGIPVDAILRIDQPLKVPVSGPAAANRQPQPDDDAARARVGIPSRGVRWATGLVANATRYLGVRYRWGGMSPAGFDCSGFLGYVFQRAGVSLPRTTYAMFETGTPVARDELLAGDIVFFETVAPGPSHAGVYLGDGRFIHASSGAGGVTITPLAHRYYAARYLGARRF
jgi:cell wall-associated NlpC family hydrolase